MRNLSLLFTILIAAAPLRAQITLTAPTELLSEPSGRAIATIRAGSKLRAGPARGAYTQVTLEGFVSAALIGGARDSFDISVAGARGARLREGGSGVAPVRADLRTGMGLVRVSQGGDWVQVRRTGWVRTSALPASDRATAAPSATAQRGAARAETRDATSAEEDTPPEANRDAAGALVVARPSTLSTAPDGTPVAALPVGSHVTPLSRERGWVRVSIEGWVAERDLLPADSGSHSALSAADLRADPAGTRGKVVRWRVEKLAFQTADPLRRELAPDEPYLLARGPQPENALLYLALPPSLVATAKALPDLAAITVVARVRSGRSQPVGVPILDVQTLSRR